MRTIAIVNLKGGVGKTVTVINLAAFLAKEHKQRVLVVDADSQCNSTEFLQKDNIHVRTLADILRDKTTHLAATPKSVIEQSNVKGVDLIPADDSLMDLDLTAVSQGSAQATCLRDLFKVLEENDLYDFVLIDCPPAFNAASTAALVAAQETIIPIKLDAFSLRGMANLMRQIHNLQAINPGQHLDGLLPTMMYKSKNTAEAYEQLKASGIPIFHSIRRTPKVDDMTFDLQPILYSSPKSAAATDYRFVTVELMAMEEFRK